MILDWSRFRGWGLSWFDFFPENYDYEETYEQNERESFAGIIRYAPSTVKTAHTSCDKSPATEVIEYILVVDVCEEILESSTMTIHDMNRALTNAYLKGYFGTNFDVDFMHIVVFWEWRKLDPDDRSFQGCVVMFAKRKKLYSQS